MKKNYTVYKHIAPNGKIYIGQTCQTPQKRWGRGSGYKNNPYFYNAIQKYEWDNFEHVIVATDLTKKEADYLEKYLIAFYETTNPLKGYNLTKGGDGCVGFKMSEQSKQKISKANKGRKMSDEQKVKLSEVLKGRVQSEETRRKISESNKGRVQSEETRHKISEARNNLSEETRKKLSKALKGHKASEETKKKLSDMRKGRVLSDETRRKISESNKGHKRGAVSEETKRKISKSLRKLDDKLISETYDVSKSVTENYRALLAKGVKLSRTTLYSWADRNNIKIVKRNS